MKFNFYIKANNELLHISDITNKVKGISNDWYYLSGSINLTDAKDNVYIQATDIASVGWAFCPAIL